MLDPLAWGSLLSEQTHNHRIIPIKRFFLRRSEDPAFRVKSIRLRFHFLKATKQSLLAASSHSDPLLEVGFAGRLSGTTDSGYAIRFSAYPLLSSGAFYHSGGEYLQLSEATPPHLGAYKEMEAVFEFSGQGLQVSVDGKSFASVEGRELDRGYLSLISSWHPVYITELKILGASEKDGRVEEVPESGLLTETGGAR